MPAVRVKICGITRAQDARLAEKLGAWAVGFNFHEKSPRVISPADAWKIRKSLEPTTEAVGVFVNWRSDLIITLVHALELTGVQLHGDESVQFCEQIRKAFPRLIQIKAFNAKTSLDFQELFDHPADAIMLDGYDAGLRGGTGRLADWAIARAAARNSSARSHKETKCPLYA